MKKPKRSSRDWFSAAIQVLGEQAILSPRRGATRIVVTIGETVESKSWQEPQRMLVVNLGDKLILCGVTIAETTVATVIEIEQDGYCEQVRVQLGESVIASDVVQVVRAQGLKAKRATKRVKKSKSSARVAAVEVKRSA